MKMVNFEAAKEHVKATKGNFANVIVENVTSRLEEDNSRDIFRYVNQILNTEGWLRETQDEDGNVITDYEFADEGLSNLKQHFDIPLRHAGFSASTADLLNQFHDLLRYSHDHPEINGGKIYQFSSNCCLQSL